MREIPQFFESARSEDAVPLGFCLSVGLPEGTDVLAHHDLDNFLEPLATALASPHLCFAAAKKAIAAESSVRVGRVEASEARREGWSCALIRAGGLSAAGRRVLGRGLAAQAEPLPWGPVELDIALRVGSERNWVQAWKPLIDSLVAVLGRRPGAKEFDIEDGRIVALALHRSVDPRLGHEVEAHLCWRLLDACSGGPALSYEVAGAARTPATPRQGRTGHKDVPGFEPVLTLERLQEIRRAGAGYVVVTDTANPPRLHRADCEGVKDAHFATKVIQNGGRNGAYLFTASAEAAHGRWPRLREHTCI
jgi:hypothetical protein